MASKRTANEAEKASYADGTGAQHPLDWLEGLGPRANYPMGSKKPPEIAKPLLWGPPTCPHKSPAWLRTLMWQPWDTTFSIYPSWQNDCQTLVNFLDLPPNDSRVGNPGPCVELGIADHIWDGQQHCQSLCHNPTQVANHYLSTCSTTIKHPSKLGDNWKYRLTLLNRDSARFWGKVLILQQLFGSEFWSRVLVLQ